MNTRTGENRVTPPRTDRFFERNNYWYYITREGVEIGPYDSRRAALFGCTLVIDYISRRNPAVRATQRHYTGRPAASKCSTQAAICRTPRA